MPRYQLFEEPLSTDLGVVELHAPVSKGDFIIVRTEHTEVGIDPETRRSPLFLEVRMVWHEDHGPAKLYVTSMSPTSALIPPNLRPVPVEPYR